MKIENEIVALSAVRTPIGRFGGALKDVMAYELGAIAIKNAVIRSNIDKDMISEVIFGNCRQAGNGPNPARSAALLAGLSVNIPASTINMACPSGMKTVFFSASAILSGQSDFCVAGGMDSMSTIPHMIKGLRFNILKLGDLKIEDGWSDSKDPVALVSMGDTAEKIAAKYNISRREQDEFAFLSHKKASKAVKDGLFDNEIVPVLLEPLLNHQRVELLKDETPRENTSIDKLLKLKAVFAKNGSVTAGNSSAMSDGACALILTNRKKAVLHNAKPLFKIVAMVQSAVDGAIMGEGPVVSINMVLKKANMTLDDIDLIEVNEAFAAQIIANEKVVKWDRDKLNVNGGAIALGHPTGISGARIIITLYYALKNRNKELGLASICGAGGVTTAIIIKREL